MRLIMMMSTMVIMTMMSMVMIINMLMTMVVMMRMVLLILRLVSGCGDAYDDEYDVCNVYDVVMTMSVRFVIMAMLMVAMLV